MTVFYLFIINLITFAVFGLDKYYAVKNKWRIKESMLLLLCVLGGGTGGLAGMVFFHHKTGHKKFTAGVPVIIAVQSLIYLILILRLNLEF